ncbi:hypothetical protein ONS95_000102 [Cadophora gregata]|uniref:uncharacterized protein n=1 Tax=Cadophora gregata TaxID=51156 RepID=UPI0026DA757E|nr:uncharacterized protein ONS95_000102 [Cadophora gregata]KAK0128119.1 hypothetical protein ONS95_000102 [Cadophora gregata]
MNDAYVRFVVKMLKRMPNLRSFSWHDCPHEDHIPSTMLRDKTLINALLSCKSLAHLYISFDYQWTDEEEESLNCFFPVAEFRNLTSLELYHIGGNEAEEIKGITAALSSSPHLKTLGLGRGWRCDCDGTPEILLIRGEGDFLLDLCKRYHALGKPPLKLETLRLGHGVFPSTDKPDSSNFLAKLINMSGLKTLHLFNGLVRGSDGEDAYLLVDWRLFDACISLRQLAVSRLGLDLRIWLNTVRQSVEELIVTDHNTCYDSGLRQFDLLRLPKLSYIFTREVFVDREPRLWSDTDLGSGSEAEDFWETDSELDSEVESEEETGLGSNSGSVSYELANSEDPKPEREPPVNPPLRGSQTITVLDRLHDGGVNLKRLGICLDFSNSWNHFVDRLDNLKQLTQLRLNSKSAHGGVYPTKESSLWIGVKRPKNIAERFAKVLKYRCPSLQYVQIGQWTWQYTDLVDRHFEDSDQVQIRQLEYDEMMTFELFAMNTFASEAGLPEPETVHTEWSEEEENRMERTLAEIGLAFEEGRPVDPSRFNA